MKKELYSIPKFSEVTGTPIGTARQYVANGIIPALYLGRRRMITAATLEKIRKEGLQTKKKELNCGKEKTA